MCKMHKTECTEDFEDDGLSTCGNCQKEVSEDLTREKQPQGGYLWICENCSIALDNYFDNKIMQARGN